jgi:hypothetical protein
LEFHDRKELESALDIVEAWHWLARAVRKPTTTETFSVSVLVYTLDSADSAESGTLLSALQNTQNGMNKIHGRLTIVPSSDIMGPSCWQALFESCTLLQLKSRPQDSLGKGLEASFELLLSLAAIEFCCTINGGAVFVGHRTIICPTASEDDHAQFHLITCDKGQINPYQVEYQNRLIEKDWQQFQTKQCYLGWCDNARINLGTRRISSSTFSYTGAPEKERSLQPVGYTALGQVGVSNPMSLMFGLEKNFRYDSHRVRFTPIDNYGLLLHDAARAPTMLYDLGSKRCWLVPKLSLILHMCQAYATTNNVSFVASHEDAFAIIPDLSPLGGTVIMADEGGDFLFRHLMHQISTNLMLARHSTKSSKKKELYGFEFRDVVHQPDRGACMREMELQPAGEAWSKLANAVDAVIVCKDAGDVITKTNVPMQCSTLPEGCDYLAATIHMLEVLAQRQGDHISAGNGQVKLGKNTIWGVQSDSFKRCTHKTNDKRSCWDRKEILQQTTSAPGNMGKIIQRFSSKKAGGIDMARMSRAGLVAFGTQDGKSG